MTPPTETPPRGRSLEDEVEQLERSEEALEQRADTLALTNALGFLFAFVALAASIAAIVIAASNDNDGGQNMMGGTSGSTARGRA